MNEIEDILKRMQLREPSPQLDARVLGDPREDAGGEVLSIASARRLRRWRLATALSAAAVLAIAATLSVTMWQGGEVTVMDPQPETSPMPKIAFDPVRSDTVVSHLTDEGVFFIDEDVPMRRIRRQTIQHVEWVDAERDIRMETTLPPREQWLLVPIAFD